MKFSKGLCTAIAALAMTACPYNRGPDTQPTTLQATSCTKQAKFVDDSLGSWVSVAVENATIVAECRKAVGLE